MESLTVFEKESMGWMAGVVIRLSTAINGPEW